MTNRRGLECQDRFMLNDKATVIICKDQQFGLIS